MRVCIIIIINATKPGNVLWHLIDYCLLLYCDDLRVHCVGWSLKQSQCMPKKWEREFLTELIVNAPGMV